MGNRYVGNCLVAQLVVLSIVWPAGGWVVLSQIVGGDGFREWYDMVARSGVLGAFCSVADHLWIWAEQASERHGSGCGPFLGSRDDEVALLPSAPLTSGVSPGTRDARALPPVHIPLRFVSEN